MRRQSGEPTFFCGGSSGSLSAFVAIRCGRDDGGQKRRVSRSRPQLEITKHQTHIATVCSSSPIKSVNQRLSPVTEREKHSLASQVAHSHVPIATSRFTNATSTNQKTPVTSRVKCWRLCSTAVPAVMCDHRRSAIDWRSEMPGYQTPECRSPTPPVLSGHVGQSSQTTKTDWNAER